MTYFTDNPLERMMCQAPRASRAKRSVTAPPGHRCHGCPRYGEGCVWPCYRDLLHYLNKEDPKK